MHTCGSTGEAWLPRRLAETINAEKLVHALLYRLLADAGISLERVQHEITAEIAGPRTSQQLDMAIGAALLRVNTRIRGRATPPLSLNPVVA